MTMKKSRGYQNKQKQNFKRRLLFRIAKEELIEGVREILEIKMLNKEDRIYKLAVLVKDAEGEYIVYATIQLKTPKDGYFWKLIDLSWEEVKK
jgi:hypothetical protein